MHWHGSGTAIGVPELLVGAALPDFGKPEALKARDNLPRLEDGQRTHSGDAHRLRSDELRFELRLAILKQHGDHLREVGLQFLHRRPLAMRSPKAGNVTYQQASLSIALHYRCIRSHGHPAPREIGMEATDYSRCLIAI